MKKIKQACMVAILLMAGIKMGAQNSEQARLFIAKSHVAIMKVEKEMYKANDNANASELKKAVKYQMAAVNLYKQNKMKDAVANSYKSRAICMQLCTQMGISEGSLYQLSDEENTFCKPADYSNMTLNPSLLSATQNQQVGNLNVLDVPQFHQLELSVKPL